MSHKKAYGAAHSTYNPADEVWHSLAFVRGTSATSARQHALKVRQLYREVVESFLRAGRGDRLLAFHEPIERLMDSASLNLPIDELIKQAQQADTREDLAETLYLTNPSPENKRSWIRAKMAERIKGAALILGLRRG